MAEPASAREFPALDALRGVAALSIVVTHAAFLTGRSANGAFAAVLSRLDVGVPIFFVISGFLLYRPYALASATGTAPPRVIAYLWRRFLRIVPAYWVAIVAAMTLLPENDGVGTETWVRNFTLTQVYEEGHLTHGLTQTWSLCAEVAFYLALPVAAVAVDRGVLRGRWLPMRIMSLLGLAVVANIAWLVAVHAGLLPAARHSSGWLPGYLSWFAVGMAMAVASSHLAARPDEAHSWRFLDELGDSTGASWATAAGFFAIATTPLAGPHFLELPTTWEAVFKNLLYAAVAAFVVLPAVFGAEQRGLARRIMIHGSLRWLGRISYGIFLYHLVIMMLVFRALDREYFTGGFTEILGVTTVVAVIVATLSYTWLELPLLRLKRLVPLRRRSFGSAAPAAVATAPIDRA